MLGRPTLEGIIHSRIVDIAAEFDRQAKEYFDHHGVSASTEVRAAPPFVLFKVEAEGRSRERMFPGHVCLNPFRPVTLCIVSLFAEDFKLWDAREDPSI